MTGNLVLAGTNTGIVEFDPSSPTALSTVDDTQFLPGPGPLQAVHGRVQALAFSPSGEKVYIGGDFGLIALDRAVPEPSAVAVLIACGLAPTSRRWRTVR